MIQLEIDDVGWEFDMTGEVTYENEFMGFNRRKILMNILVIFKQNKKILQK